MEYSLAERSAERELLLIAEGLGLAANRWSPLAGVILTGKYRTSTDGRMTDPARIIPTESTDQKTAIIDAVLDVAAETDRSAAQVSMAWIRARGDHSTTPLVPIIDPRTMDQLTDYLGALDLDLASEQYTRLRHQRTSFGYPTRSTP